MLQVEYTRRFKRKAETDREQLEQEIPEDSEELLQTNMDFNWFWVGSGEPVLVASLATLEGPASFAPATSPKMFSGSLDSVCFNRENEHNFVKMRLGGQDVLVWKPDSIIDDRAFTATASASLAVISTASKHLHNDLARAIKALEQKKIDDQSLQELDLEQGFKGMQEEVRNLEHCKTGRNSPIHLTESDVGTLLFLPPSLSFPFFAGVCFTFCDLRAGFGLLRLVLFSLPVSRFFVP